MHVLRGPRVLILIAVIALAVRVGVVVATPHFQPIFDAAHYDRLGASIAAGHGYPGQFRPPEPSAFRPPLYPLALAAVHAVGGGWTAGRLLGSLLGTATVLLIALICQRLWGRRVAIAAGGLAAVFPPLVLLNASLLSESLFVPLVLAVLLAILEFTRERARRWLVVAGVLCGLAALTRVNGLLLVVAAAAGAWPTPRWSRRALLPALVIALAAAVTVTPWVIRNAIVFHRFVGISTQSGYALAATYNRESARIHPAGRPLQTQTLATFRPLYRNHSLDEGRRGDRLTHSAIDYARHHPGYVLRTLAWNTLRIFDLHHDIRYELGFQASYLQAVGERGLASPVVPASLYLVIAFALLGAAAQAGVARARRAPRFVWAFPALMVLPAIAVYGLPRYRAPVDPFLVMLAGVAVVAVLDRLRAPRPFRIPSYWTGGAARRSSAS